MYDLTWGNKKVWQLEHGVPSIPGPPPDPTVLRAAALLWEEHCVECAIPECYSTCRLYVARRDKKCARFPYGIYPNRLTSGLFAYGADVRFRRWGKLEAFWTKPPRMVSPRVVRRYDRLDLWLGRASNLVRYALRATRPGDRVDQRSYPGWPGWHTLLRRRWLDGRSQSEWEEGTRPDALYIKFFNPEERSDGLVVEGFQGRPVFRQSIPFGRGWTERAISLEELNLNPSQPARLLVRPGSDREARLIFTWLDLVRFAPGVAQSALNAVPSPSSPAAQVKCVVWDLDGTLWDGAIGDDGTAGVRPRPSAIDMVRKLDERGILQSIASKNDHDVAWRMVTQAGLEKYFLYPVISWEPKSTGIRRIANALNIGLDTLAFIDDSPFERSEVLTTLPQVRVYDVSWVEHLVELPEFTVPVTAASRVRRSMYLAEAERKRVATTWGDDYDGFLRSCDLTMRVGRTTADQRPRCLELIQRSNQLNLSTRRYTDEELERLLKQESIECFSLECADRFGEYGLVGFVSVDLSQTALVDFVVSCRVAQRGVEESFIYWYARRARGRGSRRLRARLVPTGRNRALMDVLSRLPFRPVANEGSTTVLEMSLDDLVDGPHVLRVVEVEEFASEKGA
jgi:FkbH-like protein